MSRNKVDIYKNQEVDEAEGKQLARELGAIFQRTSAKELFGVENLFLSIGKRFVNSYSKEGRSISNDKGQKFSSSKSKGKGGKLRMFQI